MGNTRNSVRNILLCALAVLLLLNAGCKKKKPAIPPPQAQAPTATAPPETPPPATQPSTTTTEAPSNTGTAPAPKTEEPGKPAKNTRSGRLGKSRLGGAKPRPGTPKTTAPAETTAKTNPPATSPAITPAPASSPATPPTTGTTQPAQPQPKPAPPPEPSGNSTIAPGMSPVDEYHTKQTTQQMLDSCEGSLKTIKRQLSNDEQATLSQLRSYLTQARTALADGDVERAHNLASKARLLCDELTKH